MISCPSFPHIPIHLKAVLGRELTEEWKSRNAVPIFSIGILLSLSTKPLQAPLGKQVPRCLIVKQNLVLFVGG